MGKPVLPTRLSRQRGGADAWATPPPGAADCHRPSVLDAYREIFRPVSLETRIAALVNTLAVTALGWVIFRELRGLRTDWARGEL
jgi:hypothetical protein